MTGGWRSEYAERFRGRHVITCGDCDRPGRGLAQRMAADLVGVASSVRILDLGPQRDDGYDLSDFLADADTPDELEQAAALLRRTAAAIEPESPPRANDKAPQIRPKGSGRRRAG